MICPWETLESEAVLISQPDFRWQPHHVKAGNEMEHEMAIEDDDRPKKKLSHEIGQDLSLLSVEELSARIALLTGEIERLQQALTQKRASREAANSFFKS
jgi:uncharacterized small protein (DUF1192 family)